MQCQDCEKESDIYITSEFCQHCGAKFDKQDVETITTSSQNSTSFNFYLGALLAITYAYYLCSYVVELVSEKITGPNVVDMIVLIVTMFLATALKWVRNIDGAYQGKRNYTYARKFFLYLTIAIQPINLFVYNEERLGTISLSIYGFVMIFSLLCFYSFMFGKKNTTFNWFTFKY